MQEEQMIKADWMQDTDNKGRESLLSYSKHILRDRANGWQQNAIKRLATSVQKVFTRCHLLMI